MFLVAATSAGLSIGSAYDLVPTSFACARLLGRIFLTSPRCWRRKETYLALGVTPSPRRRRASGSRSGLQRRGDKEVAKFRPLARTGCCCCSLLTIVCIWCELSSGAGEKRSMLPEDRHYWTTMHLGLESRPKLGDALPTFKLASLLSPPFSHASSLQCCTHLASATSTPPSMRHGSSYARTPTASEAVFALSDATHISYT